MADEKTEHEKTPAQIVSDVIDQRQASLRYHNENFYDEWAEIYRNLHARTKPHRRWNPTKTEWEDDNTRTNVCVPDHFVMLRRGTARLTRNPPNLRVRGGPDTPDAQFNRDKVSAHLMYQWDRSESQRAFKTIVSIAYGLGWGIGKTYYDEVPVVRRLRRLTKTLAPSDFGNLANSGDPQIQAAVSQFGDRLKDQTPLSDAEMATMVQAIGDEASLNVSTVRYRGPVLASVFVGDFFPEPGFRSINESGYCIENSLRDEDWLSYWKNQVSIDPRTGQESPVISEKAAQDVLERAGSRTYLDEKQLTLRRRMREEIEISDPVTAGKPIRTPRKRFMVDERHTILDSHLCIDFIGEESVYLGRLWYPWETYGRYIYSEMVLLPDWLGGVGMSTLRVTRFLMMLRNTRLNQTTDFINNKLLPLMKGRSGSDVTAQDIVRTGWARIWQLDNPADFEFQQDPSFPAEAWSDQAAYQQAMQQVDPSTVDFAPGTASVAQSGKFATTAALTAKASDSVTADTLDNMGMFVRDVVELQLWMNQQAMNEPTKVPRPYFERIDAVSLRTMGAQPREIEVGPMDLQEDYEILPEQGSTLAADDEFRVQGLQQFLLLGERHPDMVNVRAVITALARATPGINAEDIILPPPPPQPPVPPVKMNITLAIKWEQLPADVQAALLQKEGLPTDLTHALGVGRVIEKTKEAANAAADLERPADGGGGDGAQPGARQRPPRGGAS